MTMRNASELVASLPSVRLLEARGVLDGFWLRTGGLTAFDGALRLFPSQDTLELPSADSWNSPDGWRSSYKHLAPRWKSIGEDAFGLQFLLSPDEAQVALFWSETGEIETLGSPADLLSAILTDPDNTISLAFYRACEQRFGPISSRSHYAFQVELAAGGAQAVENVVVMDAFEHMKALGQIALQLHDVPIGTPLALAKPE